MMVEGKVSRGSQDGSKSISQQILEIVNNSKKDIIVQLEGKLEQLRAQAKEDFKLIQQTLPAEKKKTEKDIKEELKRKPGRSVKKEDKEKVEVKKKETSKMTKAEAPKVEALKDKTPERGLKKES